MKKLLLLLLLPLGFIGSASATTLCPDGNYVGGNTCTLCPNGQYVGGQTCQLTPNGGYVGGDDSDGNNYGYGNNIGYGNSDGYGGMTGSTYGQSYREGVAIGSLLKLFLSNSNSSNGDVPITKSYSDPFSPPLLQIIPENSYKSGNGGWVCKEGYERYRVYPDKILFACRKINNNASKSISSIPENAHSNGNTSGQKWWCDVGYRQEEDICIDESAQPITAYSNESIDFLEIIKQAKVLLDEGIITEEEFEKIKQKIIDNK
jgi:hypothetical protein